MSPGTLDDWRTGAGRRARVWVGAIVADWPVVRVRPFAAILAVQVGTLALSWLVLFPSGILADLAAATGQLVQPTLSANVLSLAVLLAALAFFLGLGPRHLGLHARDLPAAVLGGAVFWLLVLALQIIAALALGDGAPSVQTGPESAGSVVAQLLGSGPGEEIEYRGFLFPACYVLLTRHCNWSPVRTVAAAIVLSQLVFALCHIPMVTSHGLSPGLALFRLSETFLAGACFCAAYLVTRNLLAVASVHAAFNLSLVVVDSPLPKPWADYLAIPLWLLAWRLVARSPTSVDASDP